MRCQGVADSRSEGARKALIAVFAHQGELNSIGNFTPVPDQLVETLDTPMQGVGAVIGGKMVLLAIERKTSVGDPVAVAPYDGSKVALGIGRIAAQGLVTQHDVARLTAAVGNLERHQTCAVGHDARLQSTLFEGVNLHLG